MMLVVDIGNSRIKWARVTEDGLADPGEAPHGESAGEGVGALVQAQPGAVRRLLACNVGGSAMAAALTEAAHARWGIAPEFVTPMRQGFGVRCAYAEPSRLGADRWAALIAAHRLAPGAAGVIDAGTTVTLDAVDAHGQHLGGLILAGPGIVCSALEAATHGIGVTRSTPLPSAGLDLLGKDTDEAVRKGAMLSVASALDRALASVAGSGAEPPTVYITGGDARVLTGWLETHTEYRANLVLEGLAVIAAEG